LLSLRHSPMILLLSFGDIALFPHLGPIRLFSNHAFPMLPLFVQVPLPLIFLLGENTSTRSATSASRPQFFDFPPVFSFFAFGRRSTSQWKLWSLGSCLEPDTMSLAPRTFFPILSLLAVVPLYRLRIGLAFYSLQTF